jgi:hypothetical protein
VAYQHISGAANLSQLISLLATQHEQILSFQRSADAGAPSVKPVGCLWTRTDHPDVGESIMRWDGSQWTLFADPAAVQINHLGTIPYADDQPMGGNILTGLGAGSANGHSVRYQQVVRVNEGTGALLANLPAGGNKITGLADATASGEAVHYGQISSLLPANTGQFYQQSNRDQLANGRPVKWEQLGSEATTFTHVGFVPRTLTLRLKGTFRDQDDNDASGPDIDAEYTIRRWNADATGGFTGTAGTVVVDTVTQVGRSPVRIEVEWKYTGDLGFWLRFIRTDSDQHMNLKKDDGGGTTDDGHAQIQAVFGVGT